MPAIFLTEADVEWLLEMPAAIECVEAAFVAWAEGQADNQPRRRVSAPGIILHSMSAASAYLGYMGVKVYSTKRDSFRFHLHLYDATSGELVAIMEANRLGQMRTGAVTGVATRAMSRPDASVVGCFGTGFQARTQLQAVCAVRKVELIEVYSRDEERRQQFAAEMTELCNVPVKAMHQPEHVAAEKDIVITATSSKVPLFDGRVLDEGTHLNVVGSNWLTKAEVDVATITRADHIVCDDIVACQLEAGDFVSVIEAGSFTWDRVHNLCDVLTGRETGRANPADVTLFKSVGLALEDIAVAVYVYRRALTESAGQKLPF
ncbi:ornithine cyclodeaminase family protein [bacterium]|nr:ornithine cyclodeaminase family protein [bacterium]